LDERKVDGISTFHLLPRKSYFEIAVRNTLGFDIAGQASLPFWRFILLLAVTIAAQMMYSWHFWLVQVSL
jgi:hypothetical protein